MTWIDKLEIGLKEGAPYRRDNLPKSQIRGPETDAGPGRSAEVPLSRGDGTDKAAHDEGADSAPATPEHEDD